MRKLLLTGEHELVIDDKNRLLIPAEIRKSMSPEQDGNAFFLVPGLNSKPWLYPDVYYRELANQTESDITPGEEQLDFAHANFSLATRIEWDSQGRVLIPEKYMRRTKISREVTVIGAGDHLEIWSQEQWNERRDDLFARHAEIAIRAKRARQANAGPNNNGGLGRHDGAPPNRA